MDIFFYLFSSIIVLGSVGVVTSTNPVYAVLWLVFTFLNSSAIFVLLGAEFIAMTIVVVYVGAVAVLFLFVVMMLRVGENGKKDQSFRKFLGNKFISIGLMILLVIDLCLIIRASFAGGYDIAYLSNPHNNETANTHLIGQILYTDYIVPFQVCGLILLTAMIGSIVLTLRKREGVRKQVASSQLLRDPKKSIELTKVKFKEGIDGIKYD
jgi:NADH-quinone oxidoreductase subunit J